MRVIVSLWLGSAVAPSFAARHATITAADVVLFLRVGLTEPEILAQLKDEGFGEPLDPTRETALREAGASETLIVAIRRVAPVGKATPFVPPPGGTEASSTRLPTSPAEPTFVARARSVRVPVSVLDKTGQPVVGLTQADFRILEDGKRQDLTLFSPERRPLRVALVLDVSGSMENKALQVEEAFKYFIDLLEPADQVLVMTFNADVQIAQDFTSDRSALAAALDAIEPRGGTALYDAAYEAIKRIAAGPAESKAVVLVTDGVDNQSITSFERLRELARRSEVPVYSIGLDREASPRHATRRPGSAGGHHGGWSGGGGFGGGRRGGSGGAGRKSFDGKPLTELAEETGGTAQVLKGPEHYTPGSEEPGSARLKAAVESIAMILRHRYLLGYEPVEGQPGWRAIHVDVDRSAATTRARKGYFAATGG